MDLCIVNVFPGDLLFGLHTKCAFIFLPTVFGLHRNTSKVGKNHHSQYSTGVIIYFLKNRTFAYSTILTNIQSQ